MQWKLHKATLLYRRPENDKSVDAYLVGDIYEFPNPLFYEVDPKTQKCRETLQCFEVLNESLALRPVRRGCWLPPVRQAPPMEQRRRFRYGKQAKTSIQKEPK